MIRIYLVNYRFLPVLALIAFILFTCEKPERDNPWDALSRLAPGLWAPQDFKVERVDLTSARLTWTYSDHNIEGFRLDRRIDGGEWQFGYMGFTKDDRTWTDDDIVPGHGLKYYYRLYAFAGNNESASRDLVFDASVPLPVDFLVSVLSPTSVTLSWNYDHHGHDGFRLARKRNEEDWQESFAELGKDDESYNDQQVNLANNSYRYRLCVYIGEYTSENVEAYISRPTLSTTQVTGITSTSATSGGNITDSGSSPVTARGIVWGTEQDPTLEDNEGLTEDGSGTGEFTSELTGLQPGINYYVRAYATSSIGTSYGEQVEFTTLDDDQDDWPRDTETQVIEVTNPATGRVWMDRNLGADRVATSSTDAEAYGHLYQWGRAADGHQIRSSGTTIYLSMSNTPGHANFITPGSIPYDWRSPQNDNLWQDVNGINNPCPSGYRLPTEAELDAERQSWSSNNAAGAFASPLKLPLSGARESSSGTLGSVGSSGSYWSSTVAGLNSRDLYFSSGGSAMGSDDRAYGYSVRCIKD